MSSSHHRIISTRRVVDAIGGWGWGGGRQCCTWCSTAPSWRPVQWRRPSPDQRAVNQTPPASYAYVIFLSDSTGIYQSSNTPASSTGLTGLTLSYTGGTSFPQENSPSNITHTCWNVLLEQRTDTGPHTSTGPLSINSQKSGNICLPYVLVWCGCCCFC